MVFKFNGNGISTGPVINVTLAPRLDNSEAIAKPCLPDDLLLTNLTGSISSIVGPAVTITEIPFNVVFFFRLNLDSNSLKIV